ncbi:hypothetical protein SCHPADRAFT_904583 [Schizopora paradoxa]|uniref:Uncharacterized protein n=1 Tax=Schizopora paradoxa TaxID=27342 RepID=A0A0H2RM72_9AGAM|nr:hypothetical protein SCHPADRAFT_904583 [Schizopora paradoxa]
MQQKDVYIVTRLRLSRAAKQPESCALTPLSHVRKFMLPQVIVVIMFLFSSGADICMSVT